jgi:hypothetical protein
MVVFTLVKSLVAANQFKEAIKEANATTFKQLDKNV